MISRPQPAHWFRLLVAHEDLPSALSTLASRQGVEPEVDDKAAHPTLSPDLAGRLNHFRQLSQRYNPFWPSIEQDSPEQDSPVEIAGNQPLTVLDQALQALEQWRVDADPLIRQLQEKQGLQSELYTHLDLAVHLGEGPLDLALFARGGQHWLASRLFVLPKTATLPDIPASMILRTVPGAHATFLMVVAPPEVMRGFAEEVTSAKGRVLGFPPWPQGTAQEALPELQVLWEKSISQIRKIKKDLAAISHHHGIADHLRAVSILQWFFSVMEKAIPGNRLAQVEGWTDDGDESAINHALQRSGVHALLDLAGPGRGEPPAILSNPWWAKPFELFPRLLGTLGCHEVDPSRILFLIAPLLFGYMFGDVGQGLVLLGAGALWRDRFEASWLLILGGMWAIFFGFMFGSFFCYEALLPALWLHPTQHPMVVLAVPLYFGAGILLTGLVLGALAALWQGAWRDWWLRESWIVVLYVGLATALFHPWGWMLSAAGVAWWLLGNLLVFSGMKAFLGRLAHGLEMTLQLGINTLSFARVGAFALAHAGLSQAVITLAGLAENGFSALVILVFGNLLILLLEGLVVSVQTTRLILFEFFARFLQGMGRPFRPLPPPPMNFEPGRSG